MEKLKTLNELLYENELKWADVVFLRQPANRVWRDFTWKETMHQARKVTAFLKKLGLKKGDKISILSKNCPEWVIANLAISMGGFVSVPLYPTQPKDIIAYILEHADVKAIFVGMLDNWKDQVTAIPSHLHRIALPYDNAMPVPHQWQKILEENEPDTENYIPELDELQAIIYTSGTTGRPKGVMITYGAQANYQAVRVEERKVRPNFAQEHYVLFFPWPLGHIGGYVTCYGGAYEKTTIAFPESIATFYQDLHDVSPTHFSAVPRIWTQLQKTILSKTSQEALDAAVEDAETSEVFKAQLKREIGLHRVIFAASGGAPIPSSLLEWYRNIGIDLVELYGMTENLAMATYGIPGEHKVGTVGKPRPGIEVKIGDNNEILTRSKVVTIGYYKNPEATQKAFTDDGFLKTGDAGYFDDEGHLVVTGRIGDSFKTDKGEFINPNPIEDLFAKNEFIEQMCLIGITLIQPILLVVLSEAAKRKTPEELAASLGKTLNDVNAGLSNFQKVSHVLVAKAPWTAEEGLTTATLKVRRSPIHAKFIELARQASLNNEPVVFEDD